MTFCHFSFSFVFLPSEIEFYIYPFSRGSEVFALVVYSYGLCRLSLRGEIAVLCCCCCLQFAVGFFAIINRIAKQRSLQSPAKFTQPTVKKMIPFQSLHQVAPGTSGPASCWCVVFYSPSIRHRAVWAFIVLVWPLSLGPAINHVLSLSKVRVVVFLLNQVG